MARGFSSNEAIAVGKWHSSLLSKLKRFASYTDNSYKAEIIKILGELSSDGYFKRSYLYEVRDDIDPLKDKDSLSCLVLSLYKYKKFLDLSITCTSVLTANEAEVEKLLKDIEPGYKGFTWNFLPSNTKARAEYAYSRLVEMKEANQCVSALAALDEFDSLQHVSPDQAWIDFLNNRIPYRNILSKFISETFSDDNIENSTHRLISEAEDIVSLSHKLKEASDSKISNIKAASKAMIKARAEIMLDESPIEDLARKNQRIIPGGLKAFGYKTIGNLRGTNTHELMNATGLDWRTADEIISTIQEFETIAENSARIQLSIDSKTPESTRLVLETFGLIKLRKLIDDTKKQDPLIERRLSESVVVLKQHSNTAIWPFRDEEYRQNAVREYRNLHRYLDSEYASFAKQANTEIEAIKYESALFSATAQQAWIAFERNPVQFLNILEETVPTLLGSDKDLSSGLPKKLVKDISSETPNTIGLKSKLRRYQEWGVKYILHQGNALLGDEMGLGKTVEAIASMVALEHTGATHFLVICPAGVLPNWCKEIVKHSELNVIKVHGQDKLWDFVSWIGQGGVAVTTYETSATLDFPENFQIDMLVVDEAHYVKNPESKRSRSVDALCKRSSRVLFMTGTALENDVNEMLTLIAYLNPKVAENAAQYALFTSADAFKESVSPVYYRRKREDVLTELPELTEIEAWCTLTEEEMREYDYFVLKRDRTSMRRVSWITNDLKRSSKMKRLIEIIRDAEDDNRRVIVFSFFLDTIWDIYNELGEAAMYPITGAIQPKQRQEIIDEFSEAPPGKVLISQITAGGTGINIQSASVVVICEPQFKPSTENQAISRAYRMGQARDVLVYRLLAEDTLDESITTLLQQKQLEFEMFADKSIAGAESIVVDDQDVGTLIEKEIKRIRSKHGISGNPDEKQLNSLGLSGTSNQSPKTNVIPEYKPSRTVGTERKPEVKHQQPSIARQPEQIDRKPSIKRRKKKERNKKSFFFNVAGVVKRKTGTEWEAANASQVTVVREKKNKYDENAVALHINGRKAGYVPRKIAKSVASFLDAGYTPRVTHLFTEKVPEKKRYKDDYGDYYYEEDYSKAFHVVSMEIVLDEPEAKEKAIEAAKAQTKREYEAQEQKRVQDLQRPLTEEEALKFEAVISGYLTKRQVEAFLLIAQGKPRAEASYIMGIKESSFGDYTKAIYSQFGFHSKKELIKYARQILSEDNEIKSK